MSWFSSKSQRRSTKTTPVAAPSCELFDLVIDRDWDAVENRALSNPEDGAWFDGEWREYPLFCACQYNPSEGAVRALVQAYPPAASHASKNGDLPLHIACRYLADIQVIRVLVEHDPSKSWWATKYGKTPLSALWDGFMAANRMEQYQATINTSQLLLTAVAQARGLVARETREPLCLHAALKMECSDMLLYFVLEEYQDQISQRNRLGRLPLHLAVAPGIPKQRRHHAGVFRELLERHPQASQEVDPWTGQLPLHTIAANPSYSWDEIQVIFQAYPQAIAQRDAFTGLLPFCLAASVDNVEATFCLLLARPDVLSDCCSGSTIRKKQKENNKHEIQATSTETLVVSAVAMTIAAIIMGTLYY